MTTKATVDVGTRVEAGEGDDRDTGRVVEVDGDRARVAWDSGVTTWHPTVDLTPTSERHSGGAKVSQ